MNRRREELYRIAAGKSARKRFGKDGPTIWVRFKNGTLYAGLRNRHISFVSRKGIRVIKKSKI